VKELKIPTQFHQKKVQPLQYKDIFYIPDYNKDGQLIRYKGRLKNLLLYIYPDKAYLINSLHKYWLGNNFGDFHLHEMKAAIECLSDATGVSWNRATTKKVEYGCSIETNAEMAINSLSSYKGKDFQPMTKSGKKYGARCDYIEHYLKGYNKSFEVKHNDKINIKKTLFRWEICIENMRCSGNILNLPLSVIQLFTPETLDILAQDALTKFHTTIKKQTFQLHKLSAHEKCVLAVMRDEDIREDFKKHHKDAFKNYKRIYKKIMINQELSITDNIEVELAKKFEKLIYSTSTL